MVFRRGSLLRLDGKRPTKKSNGAPRVGCLPLDDSEYRELAREGDGVSRQRSTTEADLATVEHATTAQGSGHAWVCAGALKIRGDKSHVVSVLERAIGPLLVAVSQ